MEDFAWSSHEDGDEPALKSLGLQKMKPNVWHVVYSFVLGSFGFSLRTSQRKALKFEVQIVALGLGSALQSWFQRSVNLKITSLHSEHHLEREFASLKRAKNFGTLNPLGPTQALRRKFLQETELSSNCFHMIAKLTHKHHVKRFL